MSDEGPGIGAANDAARDDGETEGRASGGRTAVVTKPQRPTGKRSRQRVVETDDAESAGDVEATKEATKETAKTSSAKKADQKTKKPKKPGDRTANPFVFVFNYLKQVVAEMRKVIWPNRKQMLTYTSVVLVFLAFMVALVGLSDFGLTKLALLVFG
ncbi:preprotein translocase subunit SecE [Mycobacterium sherrisii]|uniref:Protein translocase subunit SecE n=1 Tax=Mycobacterium sherrisii TaxID=243061 RepID=A0A1E3T2U9_9MYCO|nr:preprotein translocase subunit SecE [Mycobacterium sherrisii]MCV7028592.1 preprotein translocase subunit SecE [Mycobacterium sherrisii]MEC4764553.1 preprotein translocase subunit SecE [Mycobacterium sherrisii]ODR08163.1 preprotein translocase subunit SecE [Mycobacterium sherrisii]ORW78917.1 preprotein translocase subunit SecE [Mycobacterium sherrisii]